MKFNYYSRLDRGVSEAIGFMLIFGMVVVGVGLVTLYGYPMLLQQQTSADERIMEKNMIVLQNDIKGLAYKMVPYKETSLSIGGGSLTAYNPSSPSTPRFEIYDSSSGTPIEAVNASDLRYESVNAQTDISLQNGAVVLRKKVEQGSVMLAEPRWFIDGQTNTVVINLIVINCTEPISRGGIGTVQMEMKNMTYLPPREIDWDDLKVRYYPGSEGQDYYVAWEKYFLTTLGMQYNAALPGNGREYQFDQFVDHGRKITLVIKKYDILIKSV